MFLYRVQPGDSPTRIAQRYGISKNALLAANRHKPVHVVHGQHTWKDLFYNETVRVPVARTGVHAGVGAYAPSSPSAPHALIRLGSKNSDVALAQQLLGGLVVDGDFGPKTDAAVRTFQRNHSLSVDGEVGPNTWAALLGTPAAPVAVAPVPSPAAPAPAATPSVMSAATAALSALGADPNYCVSVGRVGTAVNTAVHNFKSAWNAANPGHLVPIGTGQYEVSVASALSSALGGVAVPPGCTAARTPATPPPPPGPPPVQPPGPPPKPPIAGPPVPPPPPPARNIPTAVLALTSINPCDQGNAQLVAQAQAALGVPVDGKYGNDTATAARRVVPAAPAGCSPRPAWWTPPGQTNVPSGGGGGPVSPPTPPPPPPPPPPPAQTCPPGSNFDPASGQCVPFGAPPPPPPPPNGGGTPGTPGTTPGGQVVVAPEEQKGLSTGAIVAGAVGVAAVVGLIAVAASGKKGGGGRRRSSSRRPAHRKSSHKRKPARRKKR